MFVWFVQWVMVRVGWLRKLGLIEARLVGLYIYRVGPYIIQGSGLERMVKLMTLKERQFNLLKGYRLFEGAGI